MGKKKKAPFKIITDAPKFRDRLGELTGNELKVWMYFWLRTGGELTSFPGNDTIASDLQISVDTVKGAKKVLRAKGWTSREKQRTRDDGTFSTVVEKTHLPWGGKASTVTVVEKTDGGKTHQQKEYSVNLEVPPSPAALEDSEIQNLEEVSKSASQLADDSVVQDTKTQDSKIKAYQLQLGTEYGDKAKFNARVDLVASSLHVHFGMPWITAGDMFAVMGIALNSLWGYLDDAEMLHLPEWAKAHKFWSKRVVNYASFAKAMVNKTETGLIAQYRARPGVKRKNVVYVASEERTPCLCGNNCKGFCQLEVEMEPKSNGRGFSHEEAE